MKCGIITKGLHDNGVLKTGEKKSFAFLLGMQGQVVGKVNKHIIRTCITSPFSQIQVFVIYTESKACTSKPVFKTSQAFQTPKTLLLCKMNSQNA